MLEKTLEISWTARRSNQIILKEINPEYSLERLLLKQKLRRPTHWKRTWCWEGLKAKGERGGAGDEMVRWHHRLDGHEFEQTLSDGKG